MNYYYSFTVHVLYSCSYACLYMYRRFVRDYEQDKIIEGGQVIACTCIYTCIPLEL